MQLRVTFYYVGDLRVAIKAYSQLLGVAPYYNDEDWARFRLDGGDLALHRDDQLPLSDKTEPVRHGAIVSFTVDDISEFLHRARALGFRMSGEVQALPYGMQARILDPWGNHLSVLQPTEP